MKLLLTFLVFIFTLLFVIPVVKGVSAAYLQFDPATIKSSSGQTFDVKVNVDAGSEQVTSVDAYILYDASLLEVTNVAAGSFFAASSKITTNPGRLYVAGFIDQIGDSETGKGTIATVTFKAKKDGSGTLTFDCTAGQTNDSNIAKNNLNGDDIIDCSKNSTASITVGAGSNSSPTATPTPTTASSGSGSSGSGAGSSGSGGSSAAPTASALPESGIIDNLLKFSVPGAILIVTGAIVRLMLL